MKTDINFEKLGGLVPCIIQDAFTDRVLMLGFMNEEAYLKTLNDKLVTFFSRTKNRLWTKGETSGNFLTVIDVLLDCDKDTILIKAKPTGVICHTGADTCFNESNDFTLQTLESIIADRKNNPQDTSYTSSLFKKGINKIAQKVGEEAVEVVIEAKDENKDLFINEAADLLYHYLILLNAKGSSLKEITRVLASRHKK
jgi:phosphoribosyl-ATP pyrophosphohydrolase/phosphoribosyl-AMP cyclohydrolase